MCIKSHDDLQERTEPYGWLMSFNEDSGWGIVLISWERQYVVRLEIWMIFRVEQLWLSIEGRSTSKEHLSMKHRFIYKRFLVLQITVSTFKNVCYYCNKLIYLVNSFIPRKETDSYLGQQVLPLSCRRNPINEKSSMAKRNWVLGNFAVGKFAVRKIAVGSFGVEKIRHKEFSPWGSFAVGSFAVRIFHRKKRRRTELSPYGNVVVCVFYPHKRWGFC